MTDICHRGKAFWGYTPEQMVAWRDELTVTPEALNRQIALVAEDAERRLAGVGTVDTECAPPSLELLFVDPPFHGNRIGSLLLDALSRELAAQGFDRLTIDADPNAVSFYERRGARQIGEVRSPNTPDRLLPRLELATSPHANEERP